MLGPRWNNTWSGQYATVEYPPDRRTELQVGVTYTLWISEGVKTLRGVIVHQHGAGTTASKEGATAAYDLPLAGVGEEMGLRPARPSYHVLNEKTDITPEARSCGSIRAAAPKGFLQGPRRSRRQVGAS